MRGGPIDLTPFGALLTGIGWLYWLLAAAGLWWALRGTRPWKTKLLRALPIVLLFGLLPGLNAWQRLQGKLQLDRAMALFEERCKTAGEKIYRTVENVEGLRLVRMRERTPNYSNQFELDDPYGQNCGGDHCIASYLFDYQMVPSNPSWNASLVPWAPRLYWFVDVLDSSQRQSIRYTKESANGPLIKTPTADDQSSPYGVSWEDISTREDREHWIAGGAIRVIDLRTKEVIAERRGYLVDPGQGDSSGARSPWTWARSYGPVCPPLAGHNQAFVTRVLIPLRKEN